MSTDRRSLQKSHMLAIAWLLSILFSIPQVFVFHGNNGETCNADFVEGWGKKAYVLYYAMSNFFVPFVVLLYCYSKMCAVLWGNFKQKKEQENEDREAANKASKRTVHKGESIEDEDSSREMEGHCENIELEVIKSPKDELTVNGNDRSPSCKKKRKKKCVRQTRKRYL